MLAVAPTTSDLQWQMGSDAEDLTGGINQGDLSFYVCLGSDAAAVALCKADREHWRWETLSIDKQESLRPFFAASLAVVSSCEAYFSDLIHRPYQASYTIVDSLLVVRQELGEGKGWRLLPPLFTNVDSTLPARIAHAMQQALQQLPGASFDFLSDPYLDLAGAAALERAALALHLTDEGEWDYIYCSRELASMDGSKSLREKRRQANVFEKRYQPVVTALCPEVWSEALRQKCLSVAEQWLEDHGGVASDDEPEVQARRLRDHAFTVSLLENFDKHPGMRGALIEVEGQPCALAVVEAEGNTLLSHVEKSILCSEKDGWRGIYPFTRRAYLELWDKEELVNAEQDTGCPGLRDSKRRYRPLELRRKWRVSASSA